MSAPVTAETANPANSPAATVANHPGNSGLSRRFNEIWAQAQVHQSCVVRHRYPRESAAVEGRGFAVRRTDFADSGMPSAIQPHVRCGGLAEMAPPALLVGMTDKHNKPRCLLRRLDGQSDDGAGN
uniref:hypothetical protein n=1 Tax=Paractinoplanes polyasparticus TaxID=2856853 RepID=UPI001C8648EB|nr:hypothetical protein [Actinoplanes polyasparticus]